MCVSESSPHILLECVSQKLVRGPSRGAFEGQGRGDLLTIATVALLLSLRGGRFGVVSVEGYGMDLVGVGDGIN